MRRGAWLAALVWVAVSAPAWASDPVGLVTMAGIEGGSRFSADAPQGGMAERGSAGSPTAPMPWPVLGVRLLDDAPGRPPEPAPLLVTQASGSAGTIGAPRPPATLRNSPWIFGGTISFYLPLASANTEVSTLPPSSVHWPRADFSLMNIYGGAGEFQITKGDWGLFGNVVGFTLGIKGVILKENTVIPAQADRTGYNYTSLVGGQYGLSYRAIGEPLNLAAWARTPQPVALDLLAGGQTYYITTSLDLRRTYRAVDATLTSPVLGARLSWDMTERWNLGVGGQVGGFGVDNTSLTWGANLGVAYRFRMGEVPGAVTLGFRADGLYIEVNSGESYLKLNGIHFGPFLGFSAFF